MNRRQFDEQVNNLVDDRVPEDVFNNINDVPPAKKKTDMRANMVKRMIIQNQQRMRR